jgi:hypothetical protein
MQLKKESFTDEDEYTNFYEKTYYENGLLKSDYNYENLTEFEYTDDGKILIEKITYNDQNGQSFYKREYKYEGLTTRIFKYQTGYSDTLDHCVPDETYTHLFRARVGPLPIYPLNKLMNIKEIIYNERNEIISTKVTDLVKNTFSEEKSSFDELGNLISSTYLNNNILNCAKTYNYKDNVIESILCNNAISYLKYNDDKKIIEIECFEKVDSLEVFFSKTVLEYLGNNLSAVSFRASNEVDFSLIHELGFFGWENVFKNESDSILNLNCILNKYYDYDNTSYDVTMLYNSNNEIKQCNLSYIKKKWNFEEGVNDYELHEIEEKRFFIYKYNEELKKIINSEYCVFNNHPIEHIDGFTINDNEIEHLFTHTFRFY